MSARETGEETQTKRQVELVQSFKKKRRAIEQVFPRRERQEEKMGELE